MGTSIDSCVEFNQSRGAQDTAQEALTQAKTELNAVERELQSARTAADAAPWWKPFGAAKKAYKEATQQYQHARSQVSNAERDVQRNRESQLKQYAVSSGDVALSERLNRRPALSSMLGILRTIQDEAEKANSAQQRAEINVIASKVNNQTVAESLPSALHGAPSNVNAIIAQTAAANVTRYTVSAVAYGVQAAGHRSTMVELANQFNQQAELAGVATFNSTSGEGIGEELAGITQKVSAALKDTLVQLDADYQALASRCQ